MEQRRVDQPYYRRLEHFCGTHCRICGKTPVIYHHLIPLCDGGTNDVRNMIALCKHCHKLVHGCRDRKGYLNDYSSEGRPIKRNEGWETVLEDWAACRIGTREAKERLGISQKSHITDKPWVKDFFDSRGIIPRKNTIDVKEAKRRRDEYERDKSLFPGNTHDGPPNRAVRCPRGSVRTQKRQVHRQGWTHLHLQERQSGLSFWIKQITPRVSTIGKEEQNDCD